MATYLSNRLTYPKRLFLWLLGYSILLVGCFIVFQYKREKEFKTAEMNTILQMINTYILTEMGNGKDIREISLEDFHPFENIRISIISEDGMVLYDNSLDSFPGQNHRNREEIRQALESDSGYTVRRHSESTGDYYFYSATKGDCGYIVRTAVPYSMSLTALLKPDIRFMWIMGMIALIMCILGYYATSRLGQHIMRLNSFAEKVENGSVISDTEPFPDDELGAISNHIVRLYVRLQQAIIERDREHKAALYEQREKERIKKQLTNNINHELKTPVAAIKICVETLLAHEDLSKDKRDMFLHSCLSNTERLQRLLADVSLITRMDDGAASIEKEMVDISCIIRSVIDERRVIADARGIVIENDVLGVLPMFGNPSLLEAIFNNLIDNAIAYSGCTTIKIRLLHKDDKKIILSFADNGTGVAGEHLLRLFERFYRIDKGRSRAAGGTGLGLAIVKNAVVFHNGSISVENAISGGLLFRIVFPLQTSAKDSAMG